MRISLVHMRTGRKSDPSLTITAGTEDKLYTPLAAKLSVVSTLEEVAAAVATVIETVGFKIFQNASTQKDSSLYVMKDADLIDMEEVERNSALEEQCAVETTVTAKEMQSSVISTI